MISRVSLASPFSARFQESSNSCCAGVATAQVDEVRLLRRVLQRNEVAFDFTTLGGFGSGGYLRVAESRQRRFVGRNISAGFGCRQQLVAELSRQAGNLFVQLLQLHFVSVRKIGAGMHELVVGDLDQAQRLRIQLERLPLLIDDGDARKQLGIEVDGISMGSHLRSNRRTNLLQGRIGIGGAYRKERCCRPVQQPSGFLHRYESVFKGWSRRIVGDGLHFLFLLGHARLDRRLIVGILDLVEGRRVKGKRAGSIKRVLRPELRVGGLRRQHSHAQNKDGGDNQRCHKQIV